MTTEQGSLGFFLEAHFVHGLKPFVLKELRQHLKHKLILLDTNDPETIRFSLIENFELLTHIRTATAFHLGCHYPISRPKALLGHQHFQQLLQQITRVLYAHRHHSFRIQAAGSDSAIFRRLSQQIATATGLMADQEAGSLAIRIFPNQETYNQWTVLCRLTPRPFSARAWRVADYPGALNATIAAAMMQLSNPRSTDRFLNLMCGSGTLLIERLLLGHAATAVGCDISTAALAAAKLNLNAAALADNVVLLNEDATRLPFPSQSFDQVAVDLPWGQLVGDHGKNERLYPLLLQEAARIAAPGAKFVLITADVALLERGVAQQAHLWRLCHVIKLSFKNVHPRIYLLQRIMFDAHN